MSRLVPGQMVLSRAGRDQGRYFLVYQVVGDGFVSLVDGSLRKVEKPKRKKIKHVQGLDLMAHGLLNADPGAWTNSKVASAIEALMGKQPVESIQQPEEGSTDVQIGLNRSRGKSNRAPT